MMTEEEMRQQGFESWGDVECYYIWSELSPDFQRQMVEYDTTYKTQLEHHLLMAFHGYEEFPSVFYKNMYIYIQNKLYEQKQLEYYVDKVREMYWNRREQERSITREVHRIIDGNGIVRDQWVM